VERLTRNACLSAGATDDRVASGICATNRTILFPNYRITEFALSVRRQALSVQLFTYIANRLQTMPMPENQDTDQRSKGYKMRRSVMDYGMGILICCLGIFFLLANRFGVAFNIDDLFRYLFGGLCIIYGLFRVYRGYKKNYFN
jgi:hypothetical protein